jgi:hypothetical protein
LVAYLLTRDISALCDREQSSVLDAQQRRRLLEGEHLRRVFSHRGSTDDQALVIRQMLTHRVLDKPAFTLPGAVGDIVESLRLIGGQADIQWNVVTRHSLNDIK